VTTFDLRLVVEPAAFAMADRPFVHIGYEITNRGASVVNPFDWSTELLVNGEYCFGWSLAFGNGAYPEAATRLPPNQTFATSWMLGEMLFTTPGDYHLVLQLANVPPGGPRSAVDVRVRA